jgi:hypothetical protein
MRESMPANRRFVEGVLTINTAELTVKAATVSF